MPIDLQRYELFKNKKIKEFSLLKNQGHCNHNYLAISENQSYLIRKFKLTNDRASEFKIQKIASKKRIGAIPLLLDEKNGVMISKFIQGTHRPKPNQQELKKLALLIKKLHALKLGQKPNYLKQNFKFRDKKAIKAFVALKAYKKEPVLSHNDLHDRNILFGKNVKLIDWEYAGVNDRYFDLASVCVEFKLSKKDKEAFLRVYFGRGKRVNQKKLALYKVIYKELWRLWFLKLDRGEL